jgi:hypothetical protein
LPANEANTFSSKLNNLKIKLSTFQQGISTIITTQNENLLNIKLPFINNLKELIEISNKLDMIFNQLLSNKNIKSDTKLESFDTGSKWYGIVFSTASGLSLFTDVIHTVILLEREMIINKSLQEDVRLKAITNDKYKIVLSQMEDLAKHDLEFLKDKQINEIISKYKISENEDPEYFSRIKFAIDETNKLINKGMEFFPSSTATQEIKDTLPDFTKNIQDMLPKIKQLENKKNN